MPQVSVLPDGGPVEACLEFLRKRARQLRTSISTGDCIKSKLNCPTSLQKALTEPGQYYRVFDLELCVDDFKREL